MSIILDLAILVIVILAIFIGYKRGFIRTVINLIGYIAAAFLAHVVSLPISQFIFNTFLHSKSVELIQNAITKQTGEQSVTQLIDTAFAAIPEKINTLASSYIGSTEEIKNNLIQSTPTTAEIAENVVNKVVEPISTMIIQTLAFIILFIVFCIAVKLITKALKIIDKIPLIGSANAALGAVIGIVQAIVFVLIFTAVIAMIINLSGNQLENLNNSVINQSYVFKIIYEYNPLLSSTIVS